jgi:hypothetical protein
MIAGEDAMALSALQSSLQCKLQDCQVGNFASSNGEKDIWRLRRRGGYNISQRHPKKLQTP